MELAIAVVAVLVAAAAVVFAITRRPPASDDPQMLALRNDLNALRDSARRSMDDLTANFMTQMQSIGSNVQTALGAVTAQVSERLDAMNQNVGNRLNENASSMQQTSKAVNDRIANVQQTFAGLQKQVGEMSEQARALAEASKSIANLERALSVPKARGGFGEAHLEGLLRQVFAQHEFRMQYTFKSGDIADAVLFFPQGSVAIDSKFPLDNFRRIGAAANDSDRKAARRDFVKDVKKRIDEIAAKYIRPEEDTLPFALMYIPAENVYYEAAIREEDGADLYGYAIERKVMPVSPNSLYAYLHTIMVGLNGMRISQRAEAILQGIESLRVELGKFAETYETIGKHLRNASERYEDGARKLTKVEGRVESLAGTGQAALEFEEEKKTLSAGSGP